MFVRALIKITAFLQINYNLTLSNHFAWIYLVSCNYKQIFSYPLASIFTPLSTDGFSYLNFKTNIRVN